MNLDNSDGYTPDMATRRLVAANMAVVGVTLLLLMLAGLAMRLAQAGWLELPPDLFYEFMTIHGVGMVGIAGLGGLTLMWYFAGQYLPLKPAMLAINLLLFLVGVVLMLGAILYGKFAAAWTFLYPLPAMSGGAWDIMPAFWFLLGLLLVGVGFLLVCLEIGRALYVVYGGLINALGWPYLFGVAGAKAPPPTVVATAMSVLVTILALTGGAAILVLSMVNLLAPSFTLDPMLAKSIIYFFGHTIINATIYMGVIAVYELLPRYTGRPWKASRVFLAAWMGSTIMVLIIFPHHLLMDFAMPKWTQIFAQILSYTNGFPVLVVTGLGALAIVNRSGIRWDITSGLLFLSMFGWMAGIVPAVADATIVVNSVMHNTLWVPGHFHFYLLLGVLPMLFAFMFYLTRERGAATPAGGAARLLFWLYVVAGLGFVFMFLYSGVHSVPRRFAEHLPEWQGYARLASLFIVPVVLASGYFVGRFLLRFSRFLSRG